MTPLLNRPEVVYTLLSAAVDQSKHTVTSSEQQHLCRGGQDLTDTGVLALLLSGSSCHTTLHATIVWLDAQLCLYGVEYGRSVYIHLVADVDDEGWMEQSNNVAPSIQPKKHISLTFNNNTMYLAITQCP